MSKKLLSIKYQCQQPHCQVFCQKGAILLEESEFERLSARAGAGEGTFKSPSGVCRMGFSQTFKVVNIEEAREAGRQAAGDVAAAGVKAADAGKDPLARLSEEHKGVLKKLDIISRQVLKRDIDGLWHTTAAVENDILLHSIKKEEEVLFPLIEDRVPMGPALITIMKEDHRELIALLHAFRCGLQDGEILDGLVNSLVVNLRNHITKEDEEFFVLIDEYLSLKEREDIFARMKGIEESHIPIVAGDRNKKGLSPYAQDRKKLDAQIASLKSISSVGGEQSCCGGS
ncbi:MAG: hemerythrin domain-containing protein [Deltaproteobacteria bacterium]|nr:hemerythrin domain-containing protein [Deltaproteobacteria bacterium]